MRRKLEPARTYLNTSSSTTSTRKAPKEKLLVKLHSKDKETIKLKERLIDLNDKYKKL